MSEDDFSPVDSSDTPAEIADVVMRLYTAPPARQALTDDACHWRQDDEGSDTFWTDCGHGFTFTDGGPKDNDMRHCCYCGKTLLEQQWEQPGDGDEDIAHGIGGKGETA